MIHTLPSVPVLLGRDIEKQTILALLTEQNTRLVTLTGTAGIGKTTLALAIAHDWSSSPVWFCELASLTHAEQLARAIAHTLNVQTDEQTAQQKIQTFLQEHAGLLMLDNFEQLIDAAPYLSDLLVACPALHVLVTSRETLLIREEIVVEVPPLPLSESVFLFQKQARQILTDFQVSAENVPLVEEICSRLEGIPLALELAAARLLLFSLEELQERLQNRLQLLSGGLRNAPTRQQTLRNTLAWSYDLLSLDEQRLFRCLASFNGATVLAVEKVCALLGYPEPLDTLTSLLNKHLLRRSLSGDEKPRFVMLETIREYACEKLHEDGEEAKQIFLAHATYFSTFVAHEKASFAAIDQEYGNIRAALTWLLDSALQQADSSGESLRLVSPLVCALGDYWETRGLNQEAFDTILKFLTLVEKQKCINDVYAEGAVLASRFALVLGRLDQALSLAERAVQHSEPLTIQAQAHLQMGYVQAQRHQFAQAERYLSKGIQFLRSAPRTTTREQEELAQALYILGDVLADRGEEFDRPFQLLNESIHIAQQLGNKVLAGRAYHHLSILFFYHQHVHKAIQLGERCLNEVIALGYPMPQGYLSAWLAAFLLVPGNREDLARIEALLSDSLRIFTHVKNPHGTSWTLIHRARFGMHMGHIAQAEQDFHASLDIAQSIHDIFLLFHCLDGLAELAFSSSSDEALRLFAEAATLRAAAGVTLPPVFQAHQQRFLSAFPDMETRASWADGIQAGQKRLATMGFLPLPMKEETALSLLTQREREVLAYVAEGLQNKEIALKLNLSTRTIETHLRSIYTKLGINTRSAATRWAIAHKLTS